MGFFDTLLTAIAPERAVKRVAAQTAIRAINSGYSNYGASLHKKSMRGWMWHGGSPKEDIEDNLRVLRERSRDAYMGVPLATGAIKTIQATVTLFGKGDGSGETGSVSIGQGLKRDASGAIAVRIGEGLDFDSANALTVRKETVMTSEDLLDEEETQQEIVDMLK